jgi:parallel beta-helix repeat protein
MNISFYKTNNSNAIGCFANGNTAGSGITLEDSNKCTIANYKCKNNKDDGILLMINCNDNTISGNDAEGNNQENSYASNIRLTNACSNNNIQGNTCRKGEGSINPKYGIRIEDSTCEKNLVTNNDCYQSGVTAGISNAGTNTSFGAGNRNNDGTWSATPN